MRGANKMKYQFEYQIEMNKIDNKTKHYLYLEENGAVTDIPEEALKFDTFQKAEEYRKENDYANTFHVQRMIAGRR